MMQLPVSIDRGSSTPIQDQLESGIRELIFKGDIPHDIRLPATRMLSRQLKVSRNTVKIVYLNLASQGYVVTRGTAGTFVCTSLPDSTITALRETEARKGPVNGENQQTATSAPLSCPQVRNEPAFDFRLSQIDTSTAPERTWRRLLLKHLPYRTRYAKYMDTRGLPLLREAIGQYLSPLRGIALSLEQTFIVCDDYRAFEIANHAVLKPGMRVAVEDPCDVALCYLLESKGVTLVPIPVDSSGMLVDKLPEHDIAMVYVSPSHQKPMGATMPLKRRQQLVEWAARAGAYIVECDTCGEFCHDGSPLPSLFSLDENNRVIYINSFSTWIGSNVKLGYLAAPPDLAGKMQEVKSFLNPDPSWLAQRTTAEFLSSESFFGHLRRVQQTFVRRRDALIDAIAVNFGKQRIVGGKTGHHLAWHLAAGYPHASVLQQQAAKNGVSVDTLNDTYRRVANLTRRPDPSRVLLLGYSALSDEDIHRGVAQLAESWSVNRRSPASAEHR